MLKAYLFYKFKNSNFSITEIDLSSPAPWHQHSMLVRTSKRQGKKKTREVAQILFVLPKETLLQETAPTTASSAKDAGSETLALDGSQVKSFYESVVGLSNEDTDPGMLPPLPKKQSTRKQALPCKPITAQPSTTGDFDDVKSKMSRKRSADDGSEGVPEKKKHENRKRNKV